MNDKKKNMILGVLIIGVVLMTVVYATFSQTLNINGSATIQNVSDTWNIHFAHITNTNNEIKTYGYSTTPSNSITLDDTTVTVPEVTLKAPGDKVEYLFNVVNEGDITGYINVLNNVGIGTITYGLGETLTSAQKEAFQNDLQVRLTYSDDTLLSYNDTVEADEVKELKLTIEYVKRETTQAMPTQDVTIEGITASVTYAYTQSSNSGHGSNPSSPSIVQIKTYNVTLDKNGATNNPTSSITTTLNSNVISPSSITVPVQQYSVSGFTLDSSRKSNGATVSSNSTLNTSSTFDGWYTDSANGSLVLSNTSSPVLQSNVTGYTDSNGKWIKDQATTLYAHFSGTGSVTLPTIEKTGYTCGWTANENGTIIQQESGDTVTIIASTPLYGVCEENIYEITLDNQQGTGGTSTIYEKYNTGYYTDSSASTQMTISTNGITLPTKTDYEFKGYYTGENGTGTKYIDENGKITSNASNTNFTNNNGMLYAKWEMTIFSVTLDQQGGTGGTNTIYEKYNVGYYIDSSASTQMTTSSNAISLPGKSGYTFEGYYTETNGSGTQYIDTNGKITSSVSNTNFSNNNGVLYAKWNPMVYTITLNKNGATNSPTSSLNVTYNSSNLSPSSITVPEKVVCSVSVSNIRTSVNNSYGSTVSGGSGTGTFTRSYAFQGWYTSGGTYIMNSSSSPSLYTNVSGYTDSSGKWIKASDTTLYAQFSSSVSGPLSITLPTVTRSGYTCGWTTISLGTTILYSNGSTVSLTSDCGKTYYRVCVED